MNLAMEAAINLGQILPHSISVNPYHLRDLLNSIESLIQTGNKKAILTAFTGFKKVLENRCKQQEVSRNDGSRWVTPSSDERLVGLKEVLPTLTDQQLYRLPDIYNAFKNQQNSTLKPLFDYVPKKKSKGLFRLIVKLMYCDNGKVANKNLGAAMVQLTEKSLQTEISALSKLDGIIDSLTKTEAATKVLQSLKEFVAYLRKGNIIV